MLKGLLIMPGHLDLKGDRMGDTPLSSRQATEEIRRLSSNLDTDWYSTTHIKERMAERSLVISDIKHLLKTGYVYEDGKASTQKGFWKYKVVGRTPNSENRSLVTVVIPDSTTKSLKLVTIYWQDDSH